MFPGELIPLLAILLSIGGPLVLVAIIMAQAHREKMEVQKIVAEAAAAGRSPDEIRKLIEILEGKGPGKRTGSLKTALILGALTLGLAVVAPLTGDNGPLVAAAILAFLALAFLGIWVFVDRKAREA